MFDWQTLYDYQGFADYLQDPHHFDNSEFRSWLSSSALASLLEALNSSGELRVLAHSMGNVVAGEALSKYAGGQLIHTYIASQVAISAHYYDNAIAANNPCEHQEFDLDFPDTPDLIGHYHPGLIPNSWDYKLPYLVGVAGHVNNMQNWYNGVDYALNLWERNNVVKPDGNAGYFFSYTGSQSCYSEGVDHFFGGPKIEEEPLRLTVERERHMIFAYAAESWSRALGQTKNGLFEDWNLQLSVQDGGIGYNTSHYSHSREFRSNIVAEYQYWLKVKTVCGF